MEKLGKLILCLVCMVALTLGMTTTSTANVIVNAGFETDAVFTAAPVYGATGWTAFGPFSGTASAPGDPTKTGIGSLLLASGGGFGVPGAFQSFPASPGDEWDLSGYMLTLAPLPGGATFGLLKIVFEDGFGTDLVPASASIGTINFAFPGIESTPFQTIASPVGVWNFTEAKGVAPAGTASVSMFALFVDEFGGSVYFDDLSAVLIPEPSSIGLVLTGLLGLAAFGWKKRRN